MLFFEKIGKAFSFLCSKEVKADKVWIEKDFLEKGNGRSCRKIKIVRNFSWGENNILIPAVYYSGKGIVVDMFIKVPSEKVVSFLEKWQINEDNPNAYSEAEISQIEAENPMNFSFSSQLLVNDIKLRNYHCHFGYWMPIHSQLNQQNERYKAVLDCYGLDPSQCWLMRRISFSGKKRGKIGKPKSLLLSLMQDPAAHFAGNFCAEKKGDEFKFTHPITNEEFTLTVVDLKADSVDLSAFPDKTLEYPSHFFDMTYTVPQSISRKAFRVYDSESGDEPRIKSGCSASNGVTIGGSAASIGIIGGADGPTAVFVGAANNAVNNSEDDIRHAASSLRFEQAKKVIWRAEFFVKDLDDMNIELI